MFPLKDPIIVFTVLVFTMLAAPLLGKRLRVPDLVLLLGAGTLLGPNGFGMLERNSAVTLFGSVGLLYIMFLAGLDIDLHRFARIRRPSIIFGLLTFAVPQGLGTLAGHYVLGFDWPASILLASMFASHTLLAYPIASRLGIARTEPVAVTVGATIITDTLALLVLAVIADFTRGERLGVTFWAGIGLGMSVLVLFIWWGIPALTRWFLQNVTEEGGAQFLFVLLTVCGSAYLSHFAKVEPIIGAFLAGAAFNRLIPENSVLMNRVVFTGHTLFIPFFLISVGMLVDPGALVASPQSWLVAVTMVVMVIATKYIAAWLTGLLFGYGHDARHVMFGLSVVQAAATLAAVLVGYDLKIFDEAVLNGAILMIAVTCPLGAWMVERNGRRLADLAQPHEALAGLEQRLLVPVANPAYASRILELAFLLRDTARPGAIHPITIVPDGKDTEAAVARGERLLAQCLSEAASVEIPVSPSVRLDVNTSDGIVRAVKELRAGVVLAGWGSSRAFSARIFGTVMNNLLDACPSRLYFCRLVRPLNTTRRLVLPLPPLAERRGDFGPILRDAKFLARQIGAELRVHLSEPGNTALVRKVEKASPSCPLAIVQSDSFAGARAELLSGAGPDDLFLIPGERRDGVLWTPTLDGLPELLAARFPENSLLVVYPALAGEWEEALPEEKAEEESTAVFALHPVELGDGTSLDAALREMVRSAFPEDIMLAREARRLLAASAGSYPVEMAPGVALIHGHSELLRRPAVIVGRGRGGWELPNTRTAPHVLIALLSPKDQPPERHLKSLAELARRFHDPAFAGQVDGAATAEDICAVLGGLPPSARGRCDGGFGRG